MTVPALTCMHASNAQLRGIQARGLSAPDEIAYKANMTAELNRMIQDEIQSHTHHPSYVAMLQSELASLGSLTDAQLAALPSR